MADIIGVSCKSIKNWEQGTRMPPALAMMAIDDLIEMYNNACCPTCGHALTGHQIMRILNADRRR